MDTEFNYMHDVHVEVEEKKLDDEQSHVENIDYINSVDTLDSNIHMENNRIEKPLGNGSLYGQNDSLYRDINTGLQITTQQVKIKEERVEKDRMVLENFHNSDCFERRSIKQEVVESNNELENLHQNLENNKNVHIFENTDSCNQGSDNAMGANMIEVKQESEGPEEQTSSLEDKFKAEYLNSEFADPTSTTEKSDLSVTAIKWKDGSCYLENSDTGAINIYLGSEFNDVKYESESTGGNENNDLNLENNDLDLENNDLNIENNGLNNDVNLENNDLNLENNDLNLENNDLDLENNDLNLENNDLNLENSGSCQKRKLEIGIGFQPVIVSKRPDMASHSNERPHKCNLCQKELNTNSVVLHNMISHGIVRPSHCTVRPYKCSVCVKAFKTFKDHKNHMFTHSTERPFKCSVCKKGFKSSNCRSQHMVTHRAELLYKCSVCEKDFKSPQHLKKHMKSHSIERPYKCSICQKDFKSLSGHRGHMLCHSIERPFICSICNKGFKTSQLIRGHMMCHETERPYKCSVCEKDFKRPSHLRNHMSRHSDERPHRCNLCDVGFKTSTLLKRHMSSTAHCNNTGLMAFDVKESALPVIQEIPRQKDISNDPDK